MRLSVKEIQNIRKDYYRLSTRLVLAGDYDLDFAVLEDKINAICDQSSDHATLVEFLKGIKEKDELQPTIEGCDIALYDFENKGHNKLRTEILDFISNQEKA